MGFPRLWDIVTQPVYSKPDDRVKTIEQVLSTNGIDAEVGVPTIRPAMNTLASFGTTVQIRLNVTRPEHPAPSQEKNSHDQDHEIEVVLVAPVELPDLLTKPIPTILEPRISRIEVAVVPGAIPIEQVPGRLRGEDGLAVGAVVHYSISLSESETTFVLKVGQPESVEYQQVWLWVLATW